VRQGRLGEGASGKPPGAFAQLSCGTALAGASDTTQRQITQESSNISLQVHCVNPLTEAVPSERVGSCEQDLLVVIICITRSSP